MSQTAPSLFDLKRPARPAVSPVAKSQAAAAAISRQRVEQGIADGRRLHGEAMRATFRALFSQIMGIRLVRKPGFDRRHQPC